MTDWREFFKAGTIYTPGCPWDEVYQAFKARGEAEAKEPECEQGMIFVKDTLPPMFKSVLVYGYCDRYLLGKYQIYQARRFSHEANGEGWYWLTTRDESLTGITHWMELPSKPNKPPEPECQHGRWKIVGIGGGSCPGKSFEPYKDKHCRDCGEKLG